MLPLLRIHQISNNPAPNGDSTLLQYSDHFRQTNILIDCGIHKRAVADYLTDIEVDKIDLLVVSHIDLDHIGGLKEVLSAIDVKSLWVMNIDPLRRFVQGSVGFDREKLHFMECMTLAHESIVTAGKRNVKCFSVYEGVKEKIGPFLVEVLSPPFSFDRFLNDPRNLETMLATPKGKAYERFLKERGHLTEDVSTETLAKSKREVVQDELGESPEHKNSIPAYNEEHLPQNFNLASRGLLNNVSTVIRITCLAGYCPIHVFQPLTMLFPGDLEDWTYLSLKYNEYINTSVLKIPHHGSDGVKFKDQSLYHFLRPRLSLVFPYPANELPSQDVMTLLARNGLVSCSSFKQTAAARSFSNCCHINNRCAPLNRIVYEISSHGFSFRNGQSICAGAIRL